MIALAKIGEDANTITLGWTAVAGARSYRLTAEKQSKTSFAGPNATQAKFAKGSAWYKVEALDLLDEGVYPPSVSTPPLPPTITSGGSYSGSLVGTLQIRTSQPVVIQNATITQTGTADIVDANYAGADVTFLRTTFQGGTGRIWFNNYHRAKFENCDILKGWGIRADGGQSGGEFIVRRCKFRNQVFDPATNGNGSWLSHSIQPVNSLGLATLEIAWNELIGEFGQSQTEDVINLYNVANASVHDNYVEGAYPANLTDGYSGGGIIVDGPNGHHNQINDNIVVDTMNYGVAIAGGHDNQANRNRIVCDQRNDAGQPFTGASSGGIGIYVADYSSTGAAFANNFIRDSIVGVLNKNGARNDAWSPISGAISGTVSLPNPIDHAAELAEYTRWQSKLSASGIIVGA